MKESKKKLPKFLTSGNGRLTRIEDARNTDVIIPVMGPTGSGKSTFINTFTGRNAVVVSHKLRSCTAKIQPVIMDPHPTDPSRRLILVDTPGFDDTFVDDAEILRLIAAWLALSYYDGMKVAGVIYLHEISQTRMHGTSRKNLVMFSRLCGDSSLDKVILATTKWNKVEEQEGAVREVELQGVFWKRMVSLGSTVTRFTGTHESAWEIIRRILQPRECPLELLIQQELVDLQKLLPETQAGMCLRETLEQLLEEQREMAHRIEGDKNMRYDDGLRAKYEANQKAIRSTLTQIKELKIPLGRRIAKLFGLH